MEDSSQKWEIREYCSSGLEDEEPEKSILEWILGAGLNLGKKFVITGVVVSSAPIVLPPLIVVSAIGVAFSVPFGFVYASYACTQKLMSKLLPSPSPPEMNYLEFLPHGEKWEKDEEQDMYNGFDMPVDLIDDNYTSGLEYYQCQEEKLASTDKLTDGVGYDHEELAINDNFVQIDETPYSDESKKEELNENVSQDSKLSEDEKQLKDIAVPVAVEDEKGAGDYEEPSAVIAVPVTVGVATVIDGSAVAEENKEDKKTKEQKAGPVEESARGISPVELKSIDVVENKGTKNVKDSEEKQTGLENKNAKVDKVDVGIDDAKHQTHAKGKGSDRKGKKKDKRHEKVKASGETVGQARNGKSALSKELTSEAIPEAKSNDEVNSAIRKDDVDGKKLVETEKKQGESVVQTVEVVALVGSTESKGNDSVSEDSILHGERLKADEKIWNQIDAIRVIVGFKVPRQASYFEELEALYLFTGIEPPSVFVDPSNLVEFNDKLRFLMSVIGVK